MITPIRLLLGAVALAVPAWALSQTAGPAGGPITGRVLILRNHRALEGEVEKVGDQYRLRRPSGELMLPADRVLCVCGGWDEAFDLVSRQANLNDPDERLRLAKWCQMNGLHAQALAQATEAVRMRPGHQESKYLLAVLQRGADAAKGAPPPGGLAPEPPKVPALDLSAETLRQFTTRVQPILTNTCISCHSGGRGGAFQLTRCTDPTVNRRAVQQNVAAVLAQVNLDRPELSPLLIKAVSGHGGSNQAPLPDRQSKLFQALKEWVEAVGANNPHLKQLLAPRPAAHAAAALPRLPVGAAPASNPGDPPIVSTARPVVGPERSEAEPPAAADDTPPVRRTPRDPFDPVIYNNQFHPPK
jgi:hypothetical protein